MLYYIPNAFFFTIRTPSLERDAWLSIKQGNKSTIITPFLLEDVNWLSGNQNKRYYTRNKIIIPEQHKSLWQFWHKRLLKDFKEWLLQAY